MILDLFDMHSVVIQFQYNEAFLLWDRAGAITKRLATIWPETKIREVVPNQQAITGPGFQILTGLNQSLITLRGARSLHSSRVTQVSETFEVWREMLELKQIKRISARTIFTRKFAGLLEANKFLFDLNVVRWPTEKVFDQPAETPRNGVEVAFRFESDTAFTILRFRAEETRFEMELDADFFDEPLKKSLCRVYIDFDRGNLGAVDASKLNVTDWLKGYVHVLRRDIPKVID